VKVIYGENQMKLVTEEITKIGKKFIARVRIRINLQRSARTGFICRIWRFFFRGVLQLII